MAVASFVEAARPVGLARVQYQYQSAQLAVRGIMPFGNYRGDLRNRELCRED